jgi:hypothetical protein
MKRQTAKIYHGFSNLDLLKANMDKLDRLNKYRRIQRKLTKKNFSYYRFCLYDKDKIKIVFDSDNIILTVETSKYTIFWQLINNNWGYPHYSFIIRNNALRAHVCSRDLDFDTMPLLGVDISLENVFNLKIESIDEDRVNLFVDSLLIFK